MLKPKEEFLMKLTQLIVSMHDRSVDEVTITSYIAGMIYGVGLVKDLPSETLRAALVAVSEIDHARGPEEALECIIKATNLMFVESSPIINPVAKKPDISNLN